MVRQQTLEGLVVREKKLLEDLEASGGELIAVINGMKNFTVINIWVLKVLSDRKNRRVAMMLCVREKILLWHILLRRIVL